MPNFPNLNICQHPINPIVKSPFVAYEISFLQTKYSLMDIDNYSSFIKNAISRFRRSRTYKNYKSFLMNLGLDHCQLHAGISADMATIEMHHNMLTIFDIAVIITEYYINTYGCINSFQLIRELKKVHKEHKVCLVMLSLSAHQLYHHANGLFIHPDMCFGDWQSFLSEYKAGITIEIANKLIRYLESAAQLGGTKTNNLLKLRDEIQDWSVMNEYGVNNNHL